MIEKYVKELSKTEGIFIHKNEGEEDITLPYGLYKKYESIMYKSIVQVAAEIGIYSPTSQWTEKDISEMNKLLSPMGEAIEKLAILFYKDFTESANLNLYPQECRAVVFSIYINSPHYLTKAVQRTIINMVKSKRLSLTLDEISIEDGYTGEKTNNSISYVRTKSNDFYYYFEEAIISNMKDIYEEIVELDPSLAVNLKGWKNRVRAFQLIP